MRAAVFGDTGEIGVIERNPPEPRPGWVRLAVSAVGICGSDLNLLYAHGAQSKGVQPGHEVAGFVDATGDGVDLSHGSHVALEPLLGCGQCGQCRRGLPNLCPTVKLCGFTRPGGMAEYLTVPADGLYLLPGDLPASVAALAEPMAVCTRGIRLAAIGLGDRVAVLGGGSIGLLSIVAARAAGAAEVLITARYEHQRELALALGADRVFNGAAALIDEVGEQHADVVVETVGGHAETLTEAVSVARSGGRILMLGVFEGSPPLPGFEFFRKELSLRASNCYGRECRHPDFGLATQLVVERRDLLAPLVTHRFKLDQVAEAFATAADKRTRSIKVQVEP
ncbi:MAG: alcohol dehydrogenase catalytic domain-containing protein [Pseudomonadales bacterium]